MQFFPKMEEFSGTSKFHEDYIEYLEDCNANLQEKLVKIREFQSKILSERAQTRQCDNTMKEITTLCNATSEAIDNLFENFTATMNSLKIVLLWKSQISQLPEKLAHILQPGNGNASQIPASSNATTNGAPSKVNEVPDNHKNGKKCGTAKVSPMIDGHVISTPRIHLNRVNEDFGHQSSRSLGTTLSPIIEASPNTSPNNDERPLFRETRISLQRLRLDNFRGKSATTKVSQNGNGVTNGEGSGFKFRKPYDSLKAKYQSRLMKKQGEESREARTGRDRDTEEREGGRDDAPNNAEPRANSNPRGRNSSEDVDPLEGPSWLLDMPQASGRFSSGSSSFRHNFINFRRPNYSSFSRPSNDDDMREENSNNNENARSGHFESAEGSPTLTVNLNRLSEANILPNAGNGSLNEESLSASRNESELDGNSGSDISGCNASKMDSSSHSVATRSSSCRNSLRSQGSVPDIPQVVVSPRIPRESFRLSCADPERNRSKNSSVHESPKNCSVILNRESCESALLGENNNKKRKNESPASSCARRSKSSGGQSTKSETRRKSSGRISRPENPVRAKRRAAELCYQKLHNLELQMREGSLPKSKKRSRDKKKKSKAKH